MKNYASGNAFLRRTSQFLWKSCIAIQRMMGFRINQDGVFHKASNWVSLTREAVMYLLSREDAISKIYRHSFCGDEYFVPSELMSSPKFGNRIVDDEFYLKHTIGRSNAETLRMEDYPALQQSQYLFARKFVQ